MADLGTRWAWRWCSASRRRSTRTAARPSTAIGWPRRSCPTMARSTIRAGRPACEAASFPLTEACGPETAGPYHLLNAALLTTDSPLSRRRERGAESFVLSPLFCGSDATGWRQTARPEAGHDARLRHGDVGSGRRPALGHRGAGRHTRVARFDSTGDARVCVSAMSCVTPLDRRPPRGRRLPANLLDPGILGRAAGRADGERSLGHAGRRRRFRRSRRLRAAAPASGRHRRGRCHRGRRLHVRGARHAGGAGARRLRASRSRSTAWSVCGPAPPAIRQSGRTRWIASSIPPVDGLPAR